tara:strand:- start:1150 stop:1557 length:408 start_codon:yes stop_codon:yes gene_type:complete
MSAQEDYMNLDLDIFEKLKGLIRRTPMHYGRNDHHVNITTPTYTFGFALHQDPPETNGDWFAVFDRGTITFIVNSKRPRVDIATANFIINLAVTGTTLTTWDEGFVFTSEEQQEFLNTMASLFIVPDLGSTKKAT